ncbi:ubiquitin carboxyl-terminal family 1 protein [Cyclospora cayetanensis]|uniref:Ubiquitin carboxyl-terminal hydrolase n=1 Tax=Cyclospora cayetanensis TaxID=88456 RepID=A0A1D3CX08_9EIME|nr:ubiquitin carboxyl-terminal family 1 protein [Cyclospora cayetanensis]
MASPGGGWCLIESDPGVFCSLVERIGVKGVSFSEVYGLDEGSFESLEAPETNRKILGFVFLFNWTKDNKRHGEDSREPIDSTDEEAPFFATQVVENACASQAIISVLLNRQSDIADLGEPLRGLYDFTKDFKDPAVRGEAIGSCEAIRCAHNAFRPLCSFEVSDTEDAKAKDAFHFVSYIPKGNKVYELDGLKQGPLCVGECESSDWKEVVRKEILRRVEEIQARGEELRFNLLAVTTNPLDNINKALKEAQRTAELAAAKQSGEPLEEGESNCLPSDPKELEQIHRDALGKIAILEEQKKIEEAKRAEWERENARRCHDFTPFVFHLAKKGELLKAVHRAAAVTTSGSGEVKSEKARA